MSNFDAITIRDANGDPQDVGGRDDGDVFHPTSWPVSGRIEEATGVTLTATNLDIALDGTENYVLVDLGTGNPSLSGGGVLLSLQYSTGGQFYPAEPIPQSPAAQRTGFHRQGTEATFSGVYEYRYGGPNGNKAGHRILLIPTRGAVTFRIRATGGTLAGCAWARLAMQPTIVEALTKNQVAVMSSFPVSFPYTGTPYTAGDVIGGRVRATAKLDAPAAWQGAVILESATIEDYDGELGDCDLVIGGYGDFEEGTDNAPISLGYGGGILAWLEFRATPTAGQYPLRVVGTDHVAGAANGLGALVPYLFWLSGDDVGLVDAVLIDRSGMSAAGTGSVYPSFHFRGA